MLDILEYVMSLPKKPVFNDDYILLWGRGLKKDCTPLFPASLQKKQLWKKLVATVRSFNKKHDRSVKIRSLVCRDGCAMTEIFKEVGIECINKPGEKSGWNQAEFMSLLKNAQLVFGYGISMDSPTPIDALSCGTPVAFPDFQHQLLKEYRAHPYIHIFEDDSSNFIARIIEGLTKGRAKNNQPLSHFHGEAIVATWKEVLQSTRQHCDQHYQLVEEKRKRR